MATFIGTAADETITTTLVSPTVTTSGAALPGIDPDTINAGGGNDTIDAGPGDDTIRAGGGNDTVRGGPGNDTVFLGEGNDVFTWFPGDGSDKVEGQGGTDLLDFSGSNATETIDISANDSHIRFFRDIGAVELDLAGMEQLLYRAFGGADIINVGDLTGTDVNRVVVNLEGALGSGSGDGAADTVRVGATASDDVLKVASNGTTAKVTGLAWSFEVRNFELIDRLQVNGNDGDDVIRAGALGVNALALVLDGGIGNDSLLGSVNADLLVGDTGRDRIEGGKGADIAMLGIGSDRFVWRSGDGNDVVEGEAGNDTLDVSGSGADDDFAISANGARASLSHNFGVAALDVNDVERIFFHSGDGADEITVNDLAGTDVRRVDIDLSGKNGAGQKDSVAVLATVGADDLKVGSANGIVFVKGLAADTFIHAAATQDRLTVFGGSDNDVLDASGLAAGLLGLTLQGGLGADLLTGSAGNDVVIGGDGNDIALLGKGNDRFTWVPGDDNDVIEGQAGNDLLDFSGANVAENIDISANGARATFFRNVASVVMDLHQVERLNYDALGGADTIVVNDLSGTGVRQVAIDLSAAGGVGDGAIDRVIVHGTKAGDTIAVTGNLTRAVIDGLSAQITIRVLEAGDQLSVVGGSGKDAISANVVQATIRMEGGLGNDILTGGLGNDQFVFNTALDGQANVDRIRKFNGLQDAILLDDFFFAGIGAPGALAANAFHIGSAATDGNQRIIYDDVTGELFFDSDGTGANAAVLFARLAPGLPMAADDFVIV